MGGDEPSYKAFSFYFHKGKNEVEDSLAPPIISKGEVRN